MNKVADQQQLITKADATIAAKDNELKEAYTTIGSLKTERDIAIKGLDNSGKAVETLASTVDKQTAVIVQQAQDKAKVEVELENEKKKTGRWKTIATIGTVAAFVFSALK